MEDFFVVLTIVARYIELRKANVPLASKSVEVHVGVNRSGVLVSSPQGYQMIFPPSLWLVTVARGLRL